MLSDLRIGWRHGGGINYVHVGYGQKFVPDLSFLIVCFQQVSTRTSSGLHTQQKSRISSMDLLSPKKGDMDRSNLTFVSLEAILLDTTRRDPASSSSEAQGTFLRCQSS